MAKQDTLIILIPGFPENEADSTCLPLQQSLVRNLKETQPQIKIIVLSFQYPYHTKPYTVFGVDVIPFCGRNKGGLSRLLLRQKLGTHLKKIHSTHTITGLLSFWFNECAWTGNRFAHKYGLKHYCWILGQDAKKENKYPRLIGPPPGELVALSDFLQAEFEKNHGIRPQFVIPPGIDQKQFGGFPEKRDIDILAVGSLIPLKQYDMFIEIVSEIKKQIPGVKTMLVGDGPEKDKLQNLIRKSELQSTVTLAGELPHHEVLQLMQRTKVFLHPSLYEGFGVVCLEALFGGARVISFVKPMDKDIKNWHIVLTKEEMKQKTLELLQNSQLEYQSVTPFRIHDIAKKILGLFIATP